MNKYRNKKIIIDGIKFDSIREGAVYVDLKKQLKMGQIKALELQMPFTLQEAFKDEYGACRAIKYKADFVVTHNDGLEEIIDVKGYETEAFKLKWKMLRKLQYGKGTKLTIMK